LFRKEVQQKRNSLEIIAEILRIAKNGVRKTRIVYGANLNFKMLEEYLADLKKKGLLSLDLENSEKLVKTTEKGIEYLRQFEQLMVLT
jgi:predicted transcriptional regulator